MTTALDPRLTRLVSAHVSADAQIRRRVTRAIAQVWDSLDDYRDRDIARFIRQATPIVAGGQQQIATLTDAYLAQLAAANLGGRPRPRGIDPAAVTGVAVRGIDPAEEYRRPGVTVRSALSAGAGMQDAVRRGRARALSLVATDLQLAKTHTARAALATDERVVGYRRVVSADPCELCRVASTQRYHRGELMPIHPGCSCGVAALYGDADPGQIIDSQRADEDGAEPVVRQHGEISPVLAVAGQHFTGADDIAA